MTEMHARLLVFGDTATDRLSMIQSLVRHSKSSPAARTFLEQATDRLNIDFSRLRPTERDWTHSETLLGLAEQDADPNVPTSAFIPTILAIVGRLGETIVRAEQDPSILGSSENPTHILGFCSGQLAAVPLLVSRDTSGLLSIALEVLSICVRYISLTKLLRTDLLAPDEKGAWFVTYLGIQPDRMQIILDEYHESNRVPRLQRMSIGVVSEGWVTLIGTPSSFSRLAASSPEINNAPHIATDVGGPSHTPYMPIPEIDEMIGNSAILDQTIDWSKIIMYDPVGGVASYQHTSLRYLLGEIIVNILERPLRIDRVTKVCMDRLREAASETGKVFKLKVLEMGKTPHISFVQRSLTAAGLPYELVSPSSPGSVDPDDYNARGSSGLVAIVGMGGRFPDNETTDGFWKDLLAGTCHIKKIPTSRFDVDRYYDATHKLKNSTAAREGAWLRDPGLFDNRFFNISPREAMQLDPVARLALTTTHEALEMAGYYPGATPSTNPDRVATYFGITGMDWTENLHQQGLDIYAVSSIAKAFITGRINYNYKFGRGCYSLDAACASSTTAITLGVQGLLSRDCDMAIAGGASVFSSPFAFSALSRSGMLAYEGGCRAFHDDADGYARGEGVGMVVLKRLEDSLSDNDNILGVIRGAARSYSTTSTSITHPSHLSQEKAFREVLGQTAVDPEEISYVEMHGTGTQAGDLEEMNSVLNVVGNQRSTSNPLTVGAVKAAVGHGEGVAGVTSLIKLLMMLKHGLIPPQPGAPFKVNSKFPQLDRRNIRIAMNQSLLRASPKSKDNRVRMLLNSFDASGGICSLVLEEAPTSTRDTTPDPRSSHVLAVSARTALSVQQNCERLLSYLDKNPSTRLEDLAYTTTARRMHYPLRKAFVASSIEDIKRQLAKHINTQASEASTQKPKVPSVVFLFTGQGSQYNAMGKALYRSSSYFRSVLKTYQAATKVLDLPDFLSVITEDDIDSSKATPTQVQLAIVALELAVTAVLRSWGIVPDIVIGHSLGEYAALCAGGVLSPSNALYLVGRRAELMERRLKIDTYGMLATRMKAGDLEARIKKRQAEGKTSSCGIACLNSPVTTVASGSIDDLTSLKDDLATEHIQTTLLRVPFGFHSCQVEPVLPEFEGVAEQVVFNKPQVPIVSSLTGDLVTDVGVFDAHYLARQAREPVNFVRALRSAASAGFTDTSSLWIETGPDPILSGLAQKTLSIQPSRVLPVLRRSEDTWSTLGVVLKTAYENGIGVQWPVYHSEFVGSLRHLPDLPSYAWDYKDYWIPYSSPPAWEVEKAFEDARNAVKSKPSAELDRQRIKGRDQLPSSTLHMLEDEIIDETSQTMQAVFSSNTSSPSIRRAIEGHVVNGHKITPLGLFCEMALAAGIYCRSRMDNDASGEKLDATTMRVTEITLEHPVILDGSASPIILTTANISAANNATEVVFQYLTESSSTPQLVGRCLVVHTPSSGKPTVMTPALTQTVYLIKARITQLQSLAATGQAHRLLRPVVYSMFSSYVKYSSSYHAMNEVVLSSDSQDAVAFITAPVTDEHSQYICNPYLYDGVTHLAGFAINNGLRFDDPEVICLADGFSDSFVWQPLVAGKKYTTYVSLHDVPGSNDRFEGSCYIFDADDGQLLGVYSGFRFRKMKKAVLDYVLGGPVKSAARNRPTGAEHTVSGSRSQALHGAGGNSEPAQTRGHVVATVEHNEAAPQSSLKASAMQDPPVGSRKPNIVDRIFKIAAAEAGCSTEDMTDEARFDDLGIDSLLAIAVLARCSNELDVNLPATFFLENSTVDDARQALAEKYGLAPSGLSTAKSTESNESTNPMTPTDSSDEERPDMIVLEDSQRTENDSVKFGTSVDAGQTAKVKDAAEPTPVPADTTLDLRTSSQLASQDTFIYLQGPTTAAKVLFLFADESGSSGKYKEIPAFDSRTKVYGVNWATTLETISESKPSLERIAAVCASSISSYVDPSSQVILGGIGMGGVLALEVGKVLHDVTGVLVIDPAAASKDSITRAMERLKRMRILRPSQKKHMTLASDLMAAYRFSQVVNKKIRIVAVVSKTDDQGIAKEWLPEAIIRGADLQSGSFLKQPDVLASQIRDVLGM